MAPDLQKLRDYCESPCKSFGLSDFTKFEDEPGVKEWILKLGHSDSYSFELIQDYYPIFKIPVKSGISSTEAYSGVLKKGVEFREEDFGAIFQLIEPDKFSCRIYSHIVGSLPVMSTENRRDFENLYRQVACKSEPDHVNPSVNGLLISGLNNWKRIHQYKEKWLQLNLNRGFPYSWEEELMGLIKNSPDTIKDTFIIIGEGPYSGVYPEDLNLDFDTQKWEEVSRAIRIHHEFTHYALKRVYGVIRNHLWDEVVADFMGLTEVMKDFKAQWMVKFLAQEGGRFSHYTVNGDRDFKKNMIQLIPRLAEGLERLYSQKLSSQNWIQRFKFICSLSLMEMAEWES